MSGALYASAERAALARWYSTRATIAGWVAIVGVAAIVAGLVGRHLVTAWLATFVPVGVALTLGGGIVSILATQIADRYRESIDGEADQ